jgi:hypothetical protein
VKRRNERKAESERLENSNFRVQSSAISCSESERRKRRQKGKESDASVRTEHFILSMSMSIYVYLCTGKKGGLAHAASSRSCSVRARSFSSRRRRLRSARCCFSSCFCSRLAALLSCVFLAGALTRIINRLSKNPF